MMDLVSLFTDSVFDLVHYDFVIIPVVAMSLVAIVGLIKLCVKGGYKT